MIEKNWKAVGLVLNYAQYPMILVLLPLLAIYSYRITLHPLSKYPGPKLAAISGWYAAYYALKSRLHLVTYHDHQKYGSVIRHGPNKLVFNSHQALKDIYQSERTNKVSSYLTTQIKADTYSVFNCLDKRLHKIKRRMIGKALSEQKMRQFEPLMLEHIRIFLRHLLKSPHNNNEPVNLSDRCKRLGTDIIGRFGFGYFLHLQTDSKHDFRHPGLDRFQLQKQRIYASTHGEIFWDTMFLPEALCFENEAAKEDLFSYVMDARDPETGTKIGLGELVSEATFFFPAGGDTTATTITAVFFYLSRNPSCYQKAVSEIRSTLSSGSENQSGPLLSSCVYLRAVIDEALRICPPTPGTLWRELPIGEAGSEPLVVDGHLVPAGTWVGVNMYTIHHNEEYFPQSFEYRPERWLDEEGGAHDSAARKKQREVFSPFGVGSRSCIGKSMAYMEASLTLASTMWYFDFELAKDPKLAQVGGGTPGDNTGRDRVDEFQTYYSFISSHDGPYLTFTPREFTVQDLEL